MCTVEPVGKEINSSNELQIITVGSLPCDGSRHLKFNSGHTFSFLCTPFILKCRRKRKGGNESEEKKALISLFILQSENTCRKKWVYRCKLWHFSCHTCHCRFKMWVENTSYFCVKCYRGEKLPNKRTNGPKCSHRKVWGYFVTFLTQPLCEEQLMNNQ